MKCFQLNHNFKIGIIHSTISHYYIMFRVIAWFHVGDKPLPPSIRNQTHGHGILLRCDTAIIPMHAMVIGRGIIYNLPGKGDMHTRISYTCSISHNYAHRFLALWVIVVTGLLLFDLCYSLTYFLSELPHRYWGTVMINLVLQKYRQVSNIRRTLVDNKIVDHSDVVGASPVGSAPTTSSFST